MKITKLGHCCLLIEENGAVILTDPGNYTTAQNELMNIDVVVITHEHADHFHAESVAKIIENNPAAQIVTQSAVAAILGKKGILNFKILEDGEEAEVKGVKFRGVGKEHREIWKDRNLVMNTGYFIGEKLFYPGDAFSNPQRPVDVLALSVSGPWCRIADSINFFLEVKPNVIFPVHDGGLNEQGKKPVYDNVQAVAKDHDIRFVALEIGKEEQI